MIIPDLNLLLYAYNTEDPKHIAARDWWISLLSGEETIGIPLAISVGFIRLATNPSIVSPPMRSNQAVALVKEWFRSPRVIHLDSSVNHFDHLEQCLNTAGKAGSLVTDAHIAALALDHDAEIHSADQDFGLFPNVRWRNPL